MIGEYLVQKGLINSEALANVLGSQLSPDERLEHALLRLGLVKEDALMKALSELAGLPYVDLAKIDIDPSLGQEIPVKFIFQKGIVPINKENGILKVATSNPLDIQAIDELSLLLGCKVEAVVATKKEIDKVMKEYFGIGADTVDQMLEDTNNEVQVVEETKEDQTDLQAVAEDAALIKLVNQLLTEALHEKASDVHIEPFEGELRIRYRIDGVLHKASTPLQIKQFQSAIISRLKIMANLNIAEKRLPQDGRIKLKTGGREIDVRVSVIPTMFGEGIVLRLLDRSSMFFELEKLGMPKQVFTEFKQLISEPHGIILVTGPTGSGKTTTLYAALQKINSLDKKIVTIEDPIEYQLEGVNQIQIKPKIGLSFANGLRYILRHDPDIILVGEIRDLETAEIAIQSALTGHLVFSTLHTNDAPSAITRLLDMGIEPYLIASSIEGIMAQRLVRVICPHCKKPLPSKDLELIKPLTAETVETLYSGTGCEECRHTGYRGRIGIFELMTMNESLRELVMNHTPASKIKKTACQYGMKTLRQNGWELIKQGQTTPEEILRVSKTDR